MIDRLRSFLVPVLGVVLSVFTIAEVNLARLTPLSGLALFAALGFSLCFIENPLAKRWGEVRWLRAIDLGLAVLIAFCCAYLIAQGKSLGQRAGSYTSLDITVGCVGIVLVLEATRRSVGIALPILAILFISYALFGRYLPDWLFPHRGYGIDRIVAQTFLRTEGVFGTAMRVMFTYVLLFVIFGAFLEATGATQFIIDFAGRLFARSPGGAAKVAVLSSGMLGSLSGSAVANAVTSGTFTIPMMRSSGFDKHVAGGVEASASSGGALMPPVMGAGAYMMLELIEPEVTYLQIIRAALIPAILYYFSIFMIVHFYSRRIGSTASDTEQNESGKLITNRMFVFIGALASLITFLLMGSSPQRAATYALGVLIAASMFAASTRMTFQSFFLAFAKAAKNGILLIAASGCVGIIIGIVTLTGVGTALPNEILQYADKSLLLALVAIMLSSIVLGMGLPSAVCYLLMATLIGPVLNKLGVIPLAAHLFIFYFGLMSMVTPPVALAAYATASIAGASIMRTTFAAFRFSLVGFTLPFMFVYRPALLLLSEDGSTPSLLVILGAVLPAVVGILSLAAAIAGFMSRPLGVPMRTGLLITAGLLLYPGDISIGPIGVFDLAGGVAFITLWLVQRSTATAETATP